MIKSLKSANVYKNASVDKNANIYRNASIAAFVAGGVSTTLAYCNNEKEKGKEVAMKQAIFHGTLNACKEGLTYILTTQINKSTTNAMIQHGGNKALYLMKNFGTTAFKLGTQIAMNSANDILKWQKGETTKKECLQSIKKNACGIIGGFVVARGFSIVCGAVIPGVGVLAGGIAGAYIGEYVGRKIAERV